MLTRERDLDAFAYGDARDAAHRARVRRTCVRAERRHSRATRPDRRCIRRAHAAERCADRLHPARCRRAFGRDLVQQLCHLPWREAAHVFGRMLAMAHHVLGADVFTIEPYQLGEDNDEGIESGAWWFYRKLGFAPRAAAARALARREAQRIAARPGSRTNEATLRRLAGWHLFFELDPRAPARDRRLPKSANASRARSPRAAQTVPPRSRPASMRRARKPGCARSPDGASKKSAPGGAGRRSSFHYPALRAGRAQTACAGRDRARQGGRKRVRLHPPLQRAPAPRACTARSERLACLDGLRIRFRKCSAERKASARNPRARNRRRQSTRSPQSGPHRAARCPRSG